MELRINPMILTVGSLVGLTLGLLLGLATNQWQHPALLATASIFEPIGTMWINALRMIILPLVVSHLIVAIASMGNVRQTGRLGGISLSIYLVLFVLGLAYALLATPFLNSLFTVDPEALAALQPDTVASSPIAASGQLNFSEWFVSLIPANPIQAAANNQMLPVVLCAVLFGLAIARLTQERRQVLVNFFEAIAHATLVLVGWILLLIPVGVFALSLAEAAKAGLVALGMIGYFIAASCVLLIIFNLLLYPVTSVVGKVSMRKFAWSLLPAQAVAVGTRSSLASLPALLDGAKKRLKLPAPVADFILPLSVSSFKMNMAITSIFRFLFLAYVYGIELEPGYIALYILTMSALSFSSPGIPSGSMFLSLPFYLDAGIPLEAYMLLKAVDAIPDIFKTVINVSADMSVAAMANRFAGIPVAPPTPVAAPNSAQIALEPVSPPQH